MKRTLLIALLIVTTNVAFCQTASYERAFDAFEENYNTDKYDEIFKQYSIAMQGYLPLENTMQFLSGVKAQFGKINTKEFVGDEGGTGAIYKTQFEQAVLAVYIALDDAGKITGLLIKSYEEPKELVSPRLNALDGYPRNIADIIFAHVKNLPSESQLAIAVLNEGKSQFYGTINDQTLVKPLVNQHKVFEIGSITKVFTATVLASLVAEGALQLTDEIQSFYPFGFKDGITITFKSLANHTSGLPRLPENFDLKNSINPYKNYGSAALEVYLKSLLKLENEPLKSYRYSNLGAGLLGYTLGVSQKTTFQKLLIKNVFEKYAMQHSYVTAQNLESNLVQGMHKNGDVVSNWDFDALFGAGGVLSTAEDLVNFTKNQWNTENTALALTRTPTFDIDEQLQIGLGWHILKSAKGTNLYWHNGGTGGYSSFLVFNIENKSAVVILSNVSNINLVIDELGFALLKTTEK